MNYFPGDLLRYINSLPSQENSNTVILGGGLAGLSAGYCLAGKGMPVILLEGGPGVGGLSRTVRHGKFRFDLGGHRFHTKNKNTECFVKEVLNGEYLTVQRKSKIYLQNRFFDYPLKPANALFGLGVYTSLKAVADYTVEKTRGLFHTPQNISLEDWIVNNFGRTLFDIYFRDYSEKVWGITCDRISEEWVSKRIEGLSLGIAIKNAFLKFNRNQVNTLVDEFIYPPLGIGQLSDRLKQGIEKKNTVFTNTRVTKIHHKDHAINSLTVKNSTHEFKVKGKEFISSIPLTHILEIMDPPPPAEILDAASKLRYRDLTVVTVMVDREKVTDLTWMYIPGPEMPLGRIHEPRNWSPLMAPAGKTHLVAEYFCFKGDNIWNSTDERLAAITVRQLETLKLAQNSDIIDSCVIRVPNAYPLFEVGYSEHYSRITEYLDNFKNLHPAGRTGMFKYYNMDRAIESGIETAQKLFRKKQLVNGNRSRPVVV